MTRAWLDEANWVRCGKCKRKLFHVINFRNSVVPIIEIKCHSCKEINEVYDNNEFRNGRR